MESAGAISHEGTYCPGCAYDLRGLTSNRCPECGMDIDRSSTGIIAWESRAKIGRLRAFFRTAFVAISRPVNLTRAAIGPVDLSSARRFRYTACVGFFLLFTFLFGYQIRAHGGLESLRLLERYSSFDSLSPNSSGAVVVEITLMWQSGAMLWPVLPFGFLLAMLLSTGIAHWFYRYRLEPPLLVNRAMVLSHYLWLPFIAGIFLLAVPAECAREMFEETGPGLSPAMRILTPVVVGIWAMIFANGYHAVALAMKSGFLRPIPVVIGIYLQTLCAAILGMILFPMVIGFFRLMIGSFIN